MGIETWRTDKNADTLFTAVAVSSKLAFVSDAGGLWFIPSSMKLWHQTY